MSFTLTELECGLGEQVGQGSRWHTEIPLVDLRKSTHLRRALSEPTPTPTAPCRASCCSARTWEGRRVGSGFGDTAPPREPAAPSSHAGASVWLEVTQAGPLCQRWGPGPTSSGHCAAWGLSPQGRSPAGCKRPQDTEKSPKDQGKGHLCARCPTPRDSPGHSCLLECSPTFWLAQEHHLRGLNRQDPGPHSVTLPLPPLL